MLDLRLKETGNKGNDEQKVLNAKTCFSEEKKSRKTLARRRAALCDSRSLTAYGRKSGRREEPAGPQTPHAPHPAAAASSGAAPSEAPPHTAPVTAVTTVVAAPRQRARRHSARDSDQKRTEGDASRDTPPYSPPPPFPLDCSRLPSRDRLPRRLLVFCFQGVEHVTAVCFSFPAL